MIRLRRELLIALGVPACYSHSAPKEDPPQLVARPAPPQQPRPAVPTFDPASCDIDQIAESLCGNSDEPTCTLASLRVSSEIWRNPITGTWPDPEHATGWHFDPATTDEWKRREAVQYPGGDTSSACCLSRCTPLQVGYSPPIKVVPIGWRHDQECIPRPPKGTSQPDAVATECPRGVKIWGTLRPFEKATGDECCYGIQQEPRNPGGRPARVEGVPRFAEVASGRAWHAAIDTELPHDGERAAAWLAQARMEHASVAAFAATSLRLLALGAPPELVAGAHRAALDEIEHARIAFALASAYAGTPLAPATFDGAAAMTGVTLEALAVETFVDGCIGETLGAIAVARDAAAEPDPAIAELLRGIAVDEARHAELAWQIVTWCVHREPAILRLLAVVLGCRRAAPAPKLVDAAHAGADHRRR